MRISRPHATAGFTLVELSIVLVVIGLVIGGIYAGRQMVETAQLRGTLRQVELFDAAANTFLLKYDCLPGDCSDIADTLSGPEVNNGDGNNLIYNYTEILSFWGSLKAAGLLSEPIHTSLLGVTTKLGAGFTTVGFYQTKNYYVVTDLNADMYLSSGSWASNCSDQWCKVLTPKQAQYMDSKVDDGLPLTGNMLAVMNVPNWYGDYNSMDPANQTESGCTDGGSPAQYQSSVNEEYCNVAQKFSSH